MKVCPKCRQPKPNVGPWKEPTSSYTQLCGSCKLKEWAASDNYKKLKESLEAAPAESPGGSQDG